MAGVDSNENRRHDGVALLRRHAARRQMGHDGCPLRQQTIHQVVSYQLNTSRPRYSITNVNFSADMLRIVYNTLDMKSGDAPSLAIDKIIVADYDR